MTDHPIQLTVKPETRTILAEPDNGNVLDACVGDTITWSCNENFRILFIELSGKGPDLEKDEGGPGKPVKVTLKGGKFFEYIIRTGDGLVLDPYIIITKP